ncbi:MAG TPA: ABC transporter substrate-binding protein [Firmicutes bacterium]|nr:ABC transporter substrate-binding protein [Bacillota bacterium]
MKKMLAFLMAGVLLTGCASGGNDSNSDDSEDKKETITVWAWDKNFNIPVMEEAAKIYEADHPDVKIEIIDYAKADVETKLLTGLSTGSTKNLPDIVLMEDYGAQKYLNSYPGMFEDLTGKINQDDFAQYKIVPFTVDGKLYGVPFDSGVTGLFYRTDILAEAGYTSEDLQNITWEDFQKIGEDVVAKTGKAMLGDNLNEMSGLTRIMLQSAGNWYFDENGEVTIADNKVMEEAFNIFKTWKETGIIKNTNGWEEWVGAMNDGSVATVVSGSWIIGSIIAANDQSGLWGVAPLPKMNTVDSVNASNIGGSSWVVLSGKETTNTAIDFLNETFAKSDEFYQTILTNVGAIGTYIPAQSGSAYETQSEFFGGQTIYKDFSKWMQEVPEVNYGTYVGEADNAVHAVMPDLISGKISVTDALEKIESTVKNQIK